MVRPSQPSPQGTPAALPYRKLSCLSSTSESRAAPRWEGRGRRGGANRPLALPIREAVRSLASSHVWAVAGDMTGKDKQTAIKEGLAHS